MTIALLTPFLTGYRMPLFERLARDHAVEVLCYGGGERYVPPWTARDQERLRAAARFPVRSLDGGAGAAFAVARSYDAVIAPYAGGELLLAAYLGARRFDRRFVLWASVWAQPWSLTNALALPATRHIYRHADAVVCYGEHVRRFVARIRGRDDDVFVAPQAVEADVFGRHVDPGEVAAFRARHGLAADPIVLYAGRIVPEKGVDFLLDAWASRDPRATLVLIGDGPLRPRAERMVRVRVIDPVPREALHVAYAAAAFTVLPSVRGRRFREPWGLVCNESMHQGRPVIATDAVGAAAGGLVRDGETGLVVPSGDMRPRGAPSRGRLQLRRDGRRLPARAGLRPCGSGRDRGSPRLTASPTRRRT
jgi:glycosyltransferase involved in cell wall biosynthesis